MADHLEVEQKFEVDPGFTLPDLSGVPGCARVSGPQMHNLSALYYDTADLRLAANGITLRRRSGGTDAGWHLKLPAGEPGARREYHEAPLPDGAAIPPRLTALITGILAGEPLAPVARLDTSRTVLTLMTSADTPCVEVADDCVTAVRTAPPRRQVSWREVEIEVSDAGTGPAALSAAAGLLLDAGARPSRSGSKLARALGDW
jgi:inorganic triphosphatase YgiF